MRHQLEGGSGMHYCHSHCVLMSVADLCFAVHRDVKPSNILLVESGKEVIAKLADFGISRVLPEHDDETTMTAGIGTTGWKAPELCGKKKEHEKKSKMVSI